MTSEYQQILFIDFVTLKYIKPFQYYYIYRRITKLLKHIFLQLDWFINGSDDNREFKQKKIQINHNCRYMRTWKRFISLRYDFISVTRLKQITCYLNTGFHQTDIFYRCIHWLFRVLLAASLIFWPLEIQEKSKTKIKQNPRPLAFIRPLFLREVSV